MQTSLATRFRQLGTRLADRYLAFQPSLERLDIAGLDLRFFFATPQALEWYSPLGAHLEAEFAWIAARMGGQSERIVDAGAFHGLYALVMAKAAAADSALAVVDPVPSNAAVIEVNLALNALKGDVLQAAIAPEDGPVRFSSDSCGRLETDGPLTIEGRRLSTVLPGATVVKLDIEGAEGEVLGNEIDAMPGVHTWIVELHPDLGVDAQAVIGLFVERGFTLHRLDRRAAAVVPLEPDRPWEGRSTLMATRDRSRQTA